MTKEERIQGLLEANNRNVEKRRALAKALRSARDYFDQDDGAILDMIDRALALNGPE